jgi:hypothetical protein
VRFERVGGASGVIGVAAIAAQFALVGTARPDAQALVAHRMRWEWTTLLRVVGGLGIIWFTAGLSARLRRVRSTEFDSALIVLGAGVLWGTIWLISALFNSVAIQLATTYADPAAVRFLAILGADVVLTLTPALTVAFLVATGLAVLAAPTFPRRYGYMTLSSAVFRALLAIVDWSGVADLAMRIMDFTLLWVVVTGIHLLGATRPAPEARP